MTNVFVLVQGQETRVQLQQTASQLEVYKQQMASQLEEDRTTQEKANETNMTGMVYTPAFPFRQILRGEGDHIPLLGTRSESVGTGD